MATILLHHSDYRDALARRVFSFRSVERNRVDVLCHLDKFGFSVIDLSATSGSPSDRIAKVATLLRLGQPYCAALYRAARRFNSEYTDIRDSGDQDHKAFSTRAELGFHVDGLLEPIGCVKTSLLYCVQPARAGGDTVVLNSVGLFAALQRTNAAAAKTLLKSDVLIRKSTLVEYSAQAIGPAFSCTADGALLTRYSDGATEVWNAAAADERDFQRAIDFFRSQSKYDGEWRISIHLGASECLVLCNDRVSHARTRYESDVHSQRHMVRALYLDRAT